MGYEDLKALGVLEEVLEDPDMDDWIRESLEDLGNGSLQGYLFRCLHCGKHLLHVDCD